MTYTTTNTTCGEACWKAAEHVCRRSCGGKNHEILLSENGERPSRTYLISGRRYRLISSFLEAAARQQ